NETLLDLSTLQPLFETTFGDAFVLDEWFHQVILYAEALTLVGDYRPFGEVAVAAFRMIAGNYRVKLQDDAAAELIRGLRTLPAHSDVEPALRRLQKAGIRMVALTNSPPAVARDQIANAGLQPYFERIFSVDAVRRYKPSPEPYRMVAE